MNLVVEELIGTQLSRGSFLDGADSEWLHLCVLSLVET